MSDLVLANRAADCRRLKAPVLDSVSSPIRVSVVAGRALLGCKKSRDTGTNLYRLSAMDDEEDQETPFQEMDAHQLAAKTAWLRVFIREASKRGHTREDIIALLDEPGMTVKAAVERILSTRKPK